MDVVINEACASLPKGHSPIQIPGGFYANFLQALGYPLLQLPVGDLLRQYHGLLGRWLIASPIYWQATHNDAVLIGGSLDLELLDEESHALFEAFKAFVAPMEAYYCDAHTWLLKCDEATPKITAQPVQKVQHQPISDALRALDETLYWPRFITEVQMFLSAHPQNKERSHPINGVWVWGEGAIHAPTNVPIVCENESLRTLAQLVSTNTHLYEPLVALSGESVLLFDKLGESARLALETQVQKHNVSWYWNDTAYLNQTKAWWLRLIGKIARC